MSCGSNLPVHPVEPRFSLQAAYAAPLILLAQTRQALRDKAFSDADAEHHKSLNQQLLMLLQENTDLTAQVKSLTEEIHARVVARTSP